MKYIPASEVEKLSKKRFSLLEYDGAFEDGVDAMKHELHNLLASAVELPEEQGLYIDPADLGHPEPVPDDKLREECLRALRMLREATDERDKLREALIECKRLADCALYGDIETCVDAALRKEGA